MSEPTPFQRLISDGRAAQHSCDEVFGFWQEHEIWIRYGTSAGLCGWYITVKHPDGGYLYDGWWDKCDASAEEAVAEAFRGARLLEDE
ncbi:hypothetical protein [Burkholderia cenocepacia]|uniref:hypothetical protein n=1 Tax=Burkholderia cenocepacia TaxID=95486 RepID=UPI00158C5313|nr:hypothetical protein [Burkholderia cenocepacia]